MPRPAGASASIQPRAVATRVLGEVQPRTRVLVMSQPRARIPRAAQQPGAAAAAAGGQRRGVVCPGRPARWSPAKHHQYAADALVVACTRQAKKCGVAGCLYCIPHCHEHNDVDRKRQREEDSPTGLRALSSRPSVAKSRSAQV